MASTGGKIVVVVVLTLYFCHTSCNGLELPELCKRDQYCRHNQSGLCGHGNATVFCTHQLRADVTAAKCQVEKLVQDCGSLHPLYVHAGEDPLVRMRLYHYTTWLGERAVVNFTFPFPDWTSLKLQYKVNNSRRGSVCRHFTLYGASLPLSDTLLFDCVVQRVPGNVVRDAEVTVKNDRGEGGTFVFRIPSHRRIHPVNTTLSEWHVFFYLHYDFIATSSYLPITIQSASHFPQVSYRVSIVKCLNDQNPYCGSYTTLNSTFVAQPKEDVWTVHLPIWSNPGSYAVTVHMESDECPQRGCYISVSPKFEIKPTLMGIWLSVGMGFFLIFFLTFMLMVNQRLRINRKKLVALQEKHPSVLLVYLVVDKPDMEFLSTFANFLKYTCHLNPYMVDRDIEIKDPNCWTRDHIVEADKVLLIIPENPALESITPVRNQWVVALNFIFGHYFTVKERTRKVAALILPSSGKIPKELLHVRRFKLMEEVAALVTWLHDDFLLDRLFLWLPITLPSYRENLGCSWPEVKNAAFRASSYKKTKFSQTDEEKGNFPQTDAAVSRMYYIIFSRRNGEQKTMLRNEVTTDSEGSDTTDDESSGGDSAFDPAIPSFNRLEMDADVSVHSQDTDVISDDGYGIFT